ncbi:MAG: lipocalin family protein [Planctomycetota bacterium]
MKNPFTLLLMGLFGGCASIPDGLQAVGGFEPERYLGTWYEIARLDHFFERGLDGVSAEYSANPDGSIRVVNRGYDPVRTKWKEAVGRAVFRGPRDEARLKVTFFWPFSGAYNVLELDRDSYSYAIVCGPNRSYFWILARTPTLPPALKDRLVAIAAAWGFDTPSLIFPKPVEPPAAPGAGRPTAP